MTLSSSAAITAVALLVFTLEPAPAWGQEPEPAPSELQTPDASPVTDAVSAPPAEVAPPAPVEAAPVAPVPAAMTAPSVPAPHDDPVMAAPPPEAPPEPAEENEGLPPVVVSFWTRVDLGLGSGTSSAPGNFPSGDELNDVYSTGQAELHASAKVHGPVSLTTNFVATYNPELIGSVGLLDAIVQIEPSEFLNVWLGRMLVPVDRTNFSGPWFSAPWYYPGFGFPGGYVVVPRQGPFGRNDGVTVWGQAGGGVFKYYAGAFDLHSPEEQSPLLSGRLSLHLLNPEPGYYGSSTFYGKDLLAFGVGAQRKKNGSAPPGDSMLQPDDYSEVNFDVLFEKDLGAAGVLDLEGAYYHFNGDFEATEAGWFALASYVLPGEVAGGRLQPLVRIQRAMPANDTLSASLLIDGQVAFIANAYATRFTLGYRYGKAGDEKIQALFLGAQVQRF